MQMRLDPAHRLEPVDEGQDRREGLDRGGVHDCHFTAQLNRFIANSLT
jgi:hypothetical protein